MGVGEEVVVGVSVGDDGSGEGIGVGDGEARGIGVGERIEASAVAGDVGEDVGERGEAGDGEEDRVGEATTWAIAGGVGKCRMDDWPTK